MAWHKLSAASLIYKNCIQRYFLEINIAFIAAFCIEVTFEIADKIPATVFSNCQILYDYVKMKAKETKIETKELKNILRRNPKYFCINCTTDLCKDCFKSNCITHNVQWLGNALFRCTSPYHAG